MKCNEFQKLIYLYDEIEEAERQKIQTHLTSCKACHLVYEQVMAERKMLRQVFQVPAEALHHPGALTNRIMAAIKSRQEISVVDRVFQFIQYKPLRYALGMISFLLVLFFLNEFNQQTMVALPLSAREVHADKKTAALNTSSYFQELKNATGDDRVVKPQTLLTLSDCIKACKEKGDRGNCTECKLKYAKLKLYEDM